MIPAGYPRDLPTALLRAARDFAGAGVVEIGPDGRETRLDYPILLELAARILAGLRANGVRAGDPAVVHCTEPVGFFAAFWACTLGGIRPLLISPAPEGDRSAEGRERLRRITDILGWTVLIGRPADLPNDLGLSVLDPDALAGYEPTSDFHRPAADDVAMLLLSSGTSTGVPKIVQLTHRGLVEFAAGTPAMLPVRPGQVTLNWHPLDSSGAFLLFHLLPVFTGCTNIHANTGWIRADPLRWLDLMDQYRVNHSWSPNFGYQLTATAIAADPDRHWDLSALRSLVSGGEQITVPVMSEFLRLTNRFGVVPETFVAAWGMTETVTGITFARPGLTPNVHRVRISPAGAVEWVDQRPSSGKVAVARPGKARPADAPGVLDLVSVGAPAPGTTVRIVAPNGAVLPEGRVGQVQVASARVTPGYLGNPEADRAAFPAGNWPARKWLATGDQGFLTGGQLVITGRDSERLILAGRTHYAPEIEAVAATAAGAPRGLIAACGVPDPETGTDRLVVFYALTEDTFPGLGEGIRAVIRERLSLTAEVVGVPHQHFPATPGGKILRPLLRRRWLDNTLETPEAHVEPGITDLTTSPATTTPADQTTPADARKSPDATTPADATAQPGPAESVGPAEPVGPAATTTSAGPTSQPEDASELTTELPAIRPSWQRELQNSIPVPPPRPTLGANRTPEAPAPPAAPTHQPTSEPSATPADQPVPGPAPTDEPAPLPGPDPRVEPTTQPAPEAAPAAELPPAEAAPTGEPPADQLAEDVSGVEQVAEEVSAEQVDAGDEGDAYFDSTAFTKREAADEVAAEELAGASDTCAPEEAVGVVVVGQSEDVPVEQPIVDESASPAADSPSAEDDSPSAEQEELAQEPDSIQAAVETVGAEEVQQASADPVEPTDVAEVQSPEAARDEPTPDDQLEPAPADQVESVVADQVEREQVEAGSGEVQEVESDPANTSEHAQAVEGEQDEPVQAEEPVLAEEAEPVDAEEPVELAEAVPAEEPVEGEHGEAVVAEEVVAGEQEVVPDGQPDAADEEASGEGRVARGAHAAPAQVVGGQSAGSPGVDGVAVIGLAARLPGAGSLEQFWDNLVGGVESIRRFSREELDEAGAKDAFGTDELIAASGALDDVEAFDAAYFGLSPREAELIDPSQRLFLEVCHQALEHGGYAGTGGRVGVFAGSGMNLYTQHNQPTDYLATRVAYRLGLTGPAIGVQAAWSSSLVAVHLACQALRSGDADLALAGAAAVHVPQATAYHAGAESIMSPSGHVRAFDAAADGTVGGNGVAAVLLKRLDQAVADGDTVYAVIRGSAVSNQTPGSETPAAGGLVGSTLEQALEQGAIPAGSLSYLEASATGTPDTDLAEFRALATVLRRDDDRTGFCTIGSVKPNIGHLDSAAGMAGLIKTVLMLQHRTLVPTINLTDPNPDLRLDDSPFVLGTEVREWSADSTPLRAGISAVDASGTSAHVILEEAPRQVRRGDDGPVVLPLSSPDPDTLAELAELYRHDLSLGTGHRLIDLAGTAALGRLPHRHRLAVTGSSESELAEALASAQPTVVPRGGPGPLGFAFTGQGAARRGMAAGLAARFPAFRSVLDECDRVYAEEVGGSLLELLLTPAGTEGVWPTETAQPALFAFELALARLWQSFGVQPALVVGHSVGEYAALCVAGALSTADGVRLTAKRGQLMQRGTVPGAMVAVRADADRVRELAKTSGVEIAAGNGPQSFVLSGSEVIVGQLAEQLDQLQMPWQRLDVDRAFHTSLVEPILAEFREVVRQITLKPLRMPMVSSWSGELLESGTVLGADYLVGQLRQPVLFGDAVEALTAAGCRRFLELGPDAVLSPAGRRIAPNSTWIPAQRLGQDPVLATMNGLAELYGQGTEIDWAKVYPDGGRVPLPTYPFRRVHHPVAVSTRTPLAATAPAQPAVAEQDRPVERSGAALKRIPLDAPPPARTEEPPVPESRSPFDIPAADPEDTVAHTPPVTHTANGLAGKSSEGRPIEGSRQAAADPRSAAPRVAAETDAPEPGAQEKPAGPDTSQTSAGADARAAAAGVDARTTVAGADARRVPADARRVPTESAGGETARPVPGERWVADPEVVAERYRQALEAVFDLTAERLGLDPFELTVDHTFAELGAVPASLEPVAVEIGRRFGVELTVDELFSDLTTPHKLATAVASRNLPAGTVDPLDLIRTDQPEARSAQQTGQPGNQPINRPAEQSANRSDQEYRPDQRRTAGGEQVRDPRAALAVLGSGLAELAARVDAAAEATSEADLPGAGMAALMAQQLRVAGQLVDGVTQLMREQLTMLADPTSAPAGKSPEPAEVTPAGAQRADGEAAARAEAAAAKAGAVVGAVGGGQAVEVPVRTMAVRKMAPLEYWQLLLDGAQALVLPVDRARPEAGGELATVRRRLPAELADALSAASQKWKVSSATTLLAVTSTVLGRFAAQEDLTIGVSLPSGTDRVTFPLRVDLAGEPDLGEVVQRVNDAMLGSIDHAAADLSVLELDPLYRVLVEFNPGPATQDPTLDLRLQLLHTDDGVDCIAEYRSGLFDETSVVRYLAYLEAVLHRGTTDPTLAVPELMLPIEPDLDRLRELEGTSPSTGPVGRTRRDAVVAGELSGLHTLFEQQVARTPDALALVHDDRELTYAELDRRANTVAWQLVDLGVKPGQFVAIRVTRGMELVVAILAVLKSGAAYVPLDPGVPESRWSFMTSDSGAVALVGDDAALADWLGLRLVPVAAVDGDARAKQAPPVRAAADDIAYCVYTSGSSGNPKGVVVPHRGPVNLVRHYLRTRRSLRTLQWTPVGFDVHVEELFTTLASGAALVLLSEDDRYDPDAVVSALQRHEVERLFMGFGPLTALLATMRKLPELPALREIVAGGEAMVLTHKVREFLAAHPDCRLFNEYGPEEASVVATIHEVDPAEDRPSIGRPIDGVLVRLLDQALRPVPVGAVGEIHLGGAAVAQGYLGRPEETERAFVPEPVRPGERPSGGRLYRSRDLGRWRADGTLEYLGRADDQVKIRGHRVEPGETEHVLADQPGVVDAVVIPWMDPGGDTCLIGYVVLEDSDPEVLARLMLELTKELPIYLVPADLITVEELPLDANGKLDRTRLPEPEWITSGH